MYQSQAESPTITATPAGDPPDLTAASLPPVDGLIASMTHPGRAFVYTEWLDPAIVDEADPLRRDPALDMFDDCNGPPYDAEFVAQYRAAQLARSRRIRQWMRGLLARLSDEADPNDHRPPVRHSRHGGRPALPGHRVYRALRARSGGRFGRAEASTAPVSSHAGTTAAQWCTPDGVITPASWMALNATRYMHQFGVVSEAFGRAVVQLRRYAATNPNAHFFGRPITLDDHQASRWIAEPCIHLFDCCQETDGAAGLIVTSAERAADGPSAVVRIVAAGASALFEEEIASNHYAPDLAVMQGSVELGKQLFDGFGITRVDIDVALVYDAFSPILLMQLEGLGFCGLGEAKDVIADGNLGAEGDVPCNTNGGLIGEGYIHGLNLTLEAVRQLRGAAVNQISGARTALVTASRTGVILRADTPQARAPGEPGRS